MPLTPEDVANKQFTSTRLKPGYDETEVDEFLDEVEAELTRLYRENDELRSKLAAAQRSLAEAGERGPSAPQPQQQQAAPPPPPPPPPPPAPTPAVQQGASASETATGILALAQRTADEHVAEARTQADRIIGEARTRADQLRREADDKHRQMIGSLENERVTLERKVEGLRQFEREYRTRLKAYLETQLRELEGRTTEAPGGGRPPGQQPSSQPGGQQPGGQQPGGQQGGDQQRSPFTAGAPVGQPSGDNPGGPPEQASGGYQLEDNNQDRGN